MDYFIVSVTEEQVKKERNKARELRQTQWWKNRIGRGVCHWCQGKFPPAELSMDHIVPVIRGGSSTKGNVVPCCKECNNKKKHMLPIEWEEYLSTFGGREAE